MFVYFYFLFYINILNLNNIVNQVSQTGQQQDAKLTPAASTAPLAPAVTLPPIAAGLANPLLTSANTTATLGASSKLTGIDLNNDNKISRLYFRIKRYISVQISLFRLDYNFGFLEHSNENLKF